jgi:hypothetical protein
MLAHWDFDETTGSIHSDDVLPYNHLITKDASTVKTDPGKKTNATTPEADVTFGLVTGISGVHASSVIMSFWYYPDPLNVSPGKIIIRKTNEYEVSHFLDTGSAKLTFQADDRLITSGAMSLANWHHILCIADSGINRIIIYVDGVQSGIESFSSTIQDFSNDTEVWISVDDDSGLDEFAFWGDIPLSSVAEADSMADYIYNGDHGTFYDGGTWTQSSSSSSS